MLDISDTTQDAKLTLFIEQASAKIAQYLGYPVKRATYTDEKYAINNQQILMLRSQPLQSVTSVSIAGVAVTDYELSPDDMAIGCIFRGTGWCGNYYVRGLAPDPVSGFRDIKITHVSGWYLPGDALYVKDDPSSLPIGISTAATEAVVERYRINMISAEGLKAHSEGGISDTFGDNIGLSQRIRDDLAVWKKWTVA